MPVSDREKELIRITFARIEPMADFVAKTFYRRLFDTAPDIRFLFDPYTMDTQRRKFMQTLEVAVDAVNDLEEILPRLHALGKRHISYGVREEHYGIVGSALIWTLRRTLVEAFPPHVESAWTKLYVTLAEAAMTAYEFEAELP
jgi:nitric oxide dioxygenase